MDFVTEVERATGRQIETVDIGGGLSTSYTEPGEPEQFSYAAYRARLDEAVPELFSGKYREVAKQDFSLISNQGQMAKMSHSSRITKSYFICQEHKNSNASSLYRIITEFGRSLTLKAGKTVSRFDSSLTLGGRFLLRIAKPGSKLLTPPQGRVHQAVGPRGQAHHPDARGLQQLREGGLPAGPLQPQGHAGGQERRGQEWRRESDLRHCRTTLLPGIAY